MIGNSKTYLDTLKTIFDPHIIKTDLKQISKGAALLPMILVLLYITLSYLFYMFGPYIWPFCLDFYTFIFMSAVIIAFFLGFTLNSRRSYRRSFVSYSFDPNPIMIVCIVVSIVLYFPYCYNTTGMWYPAFWRDIIERYELSHRDDIHNFALSIFVSVLEPFRFALLPLVIVFWNDLKKWARNSAFVLSIMYYLVFIAAGTNQGLFIVALIAVVSYLSVLLSKRLKGRKKELLSITAVTVLLCAFAVASFSVNMIIRSWISDDQKTLLNSMIEAPPPRPAKIGDSDLVFGIFTNSLNIPDEHWNAYEDFENIFGSYMFSNPYGRCYADLSHPMLKMVPEDSRSILLVGNFYTTNGYHGLSVALHQPFDWTYGIGHSDFLVRTVERVFPDSGLRDHTYAQKTTEAGWPIGLYWQTILPAFANDLTFPGVVVLMFFTGALFCALWRDALDGRNPFSIILLCCLSVGLMYFVALPTIGAPQNFFSFYGTFAIYIGAKVIAKLNMRRMSV